MEETEARMFPPLPPVRQWLPVVLMAWILPGAGHFMLKRTYRGMLLSASVLVCFISGLLMHGYIFQPLTGDLLTTLIYCGGYVADMAAGLLYFLARWFGYAAPDVAGHVVDYGTKLMVAAGLFNLLAMVDAWEIAVNRKD
jgi:hypothetical protein